MSQTDLLRDLSLVTNNFGETEVFADVLEDWFRFLGGKPGEVVVVDCGSDRATHDVYWQLFREGRIDKLQLIQPDHEDNAAAKESGYIQEYTAAAVASKPYLLFFHVDTLPYRDGHDEWLASALQVLDRPEIMAVCAFSNLPSKDRDAEPGWYYSTKATMNFLLIKRATFIAAAHEFAGPFILSGFRSQNPASATQQERYLIEVALERYLQVHGLFTLAPKQSPQWTVFHTNAHGAQLRQVRQQYLARRDLEPAMSIGDSTAAPVPAMAYYYGQVGPPLAKRIRIAFGRSPLGPPWRALKQRLLPRRNG